MPVAAPRWQWTWNPNTVLFLIAIAGGIVSWGYAVARWEGALKELDKRVLSLETRTAASDATTVSRIRTIDAHELRLTSLEKQATDAASAMRAVEATLNGLAADTRVMKEIMQRIEAAQTNGRSR